MLECKEENITFRTNKHEFKILLNHNLYRKKNLQSLAPTYSCIL
jgi:hypothetical protein